MTPATDLVQVELDGETVVFVPSTGALHHLDATATVVWGLLQDGVSVDEAVALLAEAYAAPRDVVAADVAAMVERLGQAALLV